MKKVYEFEQEIKLEIRMHLQLIIHSKTPALNSDIISRNAEIQRVIDVSMQPGRERRHCMIHSAKSVELNEMLSMKKYDEKYIS